MSAIPGSEERLTNSEVEAALTAFQPADWQRAKIIAASLCSGLINWTTDDLLQEALFKLIEGTRVWPRGIHPLVVLKTVMHSIASGACPRPEKTMRTEATNNFDNFIDTVVDELLAMPDEQVLVGIDPAVIQAEGGRLLQAAKAQARRARIAATNADRAADGPKALELGADAADE
jgi:hypothetical protein